MTGSDNQLVVDKACVVRFVVFGALMAFANIIPYLQTRGDYRFDGVEVAGWPFHCYSAGGIVSIFSFNPWALMGDILVAVILTGFVTWIFRAGIRKTLWKWKTWGTPFAE